MRWMCFPPHNMVARLYSYEQQFTLHSSRWYRTIVYAMCWCVFFVLELTAATVILVSHGVSAVYRQP